MKTNPSEVFILNKIDTINNSNNSRGATLEAILTDVDQQYRSDVVNTVKNLVKIGVLAVVPAKSDSYKVTGKHEGASEEVKHFIKHRTIPD